MRVGNLDPECNSLLEKSSQSAIEDGDKTRFYFEKLINLENSLCTVTTVNIALMIVYNCSAFDFTKEKDQLFLDVMLYSMLCCALVEFIISLVRTKCKLELQKEQKTIHANEGIVSSGRIYFLIGEAVLFLLQPNPFLQDAKLTPQSPLDPNKEYEFYINEILCILCLMRVYVFGRILLLKTAYLNPRSHRLCRLHGCEATYVYALKCLFKDRPSLLIFIGFGTSLLLFAFAIQVCERPLGRVQLLAMNLGLFQNAIWLTIETMTTVGFGDFTPNTAFARVVILFIVVWGIFIVPIMVVVVTNTLQMDKAQTRTLLVIKRLAVSQELKKHAAQFIGAVIRIKLQQNPEAIQDNQKRVLRLKETFRKKSLQLKSLEYRDDTYQQMSRKFQELNQDIMILNQNQQEIINYIHNNLEYQDQ